MAKRKETLDMISDIIGVALIDKLERECILEQGEFAKLIRGRTPKLSDYLAKRARTIRSQYYGNDVYIRGLIEFTNYCKNDCYYCGIRRSNKNVERYRLSKEQILDCCRMGYDLGFRTFVLQGGEDPAFTGEKMADIIGAIRQSYPDCAITLSFGEHSRETYALWKDAGADRYLLRHETADAAHYRKLHPVGLSLENRMKCLMDLKELGYQTGTGFMVGSPGQTAETLAKDMAFIHSLQPQMVGVGPFIPHHETPYAKEQGGTAELTTFMMGLIRLMLPNALLPSTTALGTIDPMGREKGILAGGNVVMPNLSPVDVRSKYLLYDNKICTGDEAAECLHCLKNRLKKIGCQVAVGRGDYRSAAAQPSESSK